MAYLSCKCGKVQLFFPSCYAPRTTTECGCRECAFRVEYLERLGGPTIDTKVAPLNTKTLDNRFVIQKGRDHMTMYKLNHATLLINIASTCCHTYLVGRHSAYHGNAVMTMADAPVFTGLDDSRNKSLRWFVRDWDPDKLSVLPKMTTMWIQEDGTPMGDCDGWEAIFQGDVASLQAPILEGTEGESFDELVESLGGSDSITIVGDK